MSKALCQSAYCCLAATEAVTRQTDPQEAVTLVIVSFFAFSQGASYTETGISIDRLKFGTHEL
jgi:hypothetical protein